MPHIAAGRLLPLAVSGPQRNPRQPNTPTLIEAGWPSLQLTSYGGLSVPAGTPAPILQRLNAEVVKVMKTKEANDGILKIGLEPASNSIEQFRAVIKADWPKWNAAIKAAKVTSQ